MVCFGGDCSTVENVSRPCEPTACTRHFVQASLLPKFEKCAGWVNVPVTHWCRFPFASATTAHTYVENPHTAIVRTGVDAREQLGESTRSVFKVRGSRPQARTARLCHLYSRLLRVWCRLDETAPFWDQNEKTEFGSVIRTSREPQFCFCNEHPTRHTSAKRRGTPSSQDARLQPPVRKFKKCASFADRPEEPRTPPVRPNAGTISMRLVVRHKAEAPPGPLVCAIARHDIFFELVVVGPVGAVIPSAALRALLLAQRQSIRFRFLLVFSSQ
jgi:hypothetical protein